MTETQPETEILREAIGLLEERLPGWRVYTEETGATDAALRLEPPTQGQTSARLIAEVRRSLTPRQAKDLAMGPLVRQLRLRTREPIIIIAPYLSGSTRETLRESGCGYVDLSGNVWLSIDYPTITVSTQGAETDPSPHRRAGRGFTGPKAGIVIRFLAEVVPPYGVQEIARATEVVRSSWSGDIAVDQSYVSRIVETLESEDLIERSNGPRITAVDWPNLLRRRAEVLDLLDGKAARRYVSREGPDRTLAALSSWDDRLTAVTGSFAAVRTRAVTVPSLLTIYSLQANKLAEHLDLIEVDEGMDVVTIPPRNEFLFIGSKLDDGVRYVAATQAVIDCLSGPGRMPAEGEALLEWLQQDAPNWQFKTTEKWIEDRASHR